VTWDLLMALISVPVALSLTPAYTAYLVGWLHTKMVSPDITFGQFKRSQKTFMFG